ncbi:MAG: hypothetical protein QM756_47515 [Polyangiaceae bacterium]
MARKHLLVTATRVLGIGVALCTLLAPNAAHAKPKLALDLEAAFPGDVPDATRGFGGGLRIGNEWNLVLVKLTPEIQGNYHEFGGASDASQWGMMAGGRVGVGLILQPSVFAHAGVGHFGYRTASADVSQTSLAYDMGLALDITALPLLDIGAHASLNGVAGDDNAKSFAWYALGGHVAFSF